MQLDTFIFLYLRFLFCVYTMQFIWMIIPKEIVFAYLIYATTLYRQSVF